MHGRRSARRTGRVAGEGYDGRHRGGVPCGRVRAGVLWAAPGVLVLQGALTAAFAAAGGQMDPATAAEFSSVGGILLVALGLDLVGVRTFRMADLLPALVVLPAAVAVARWVESILAALTAAIG